MWILTLILIVVIPVQKDGSIGTYVSFKGVFNGKGHRPLTDGGFFNISLQ